MICIAGIVSSAALVRGFVGYLKVLTPVNESVIIVALIVLLGLVAIWGVFDGSWPQTMPAKTLGSILYLGIIGTVIGFTLYMYLLKKQSPSTLAMITLVTPVTVLYLGNWLNNETIGSTVWAGTGMILMGLILYNKPGQLFRRLCA